LDIFDIKIGKELREILYNFPLGVSFLMYIPFAPQKTKRKILKFLQKNPKIEMKVNTLYTLYFYLDIMYTC